MSRSKRATAEKAATQHATDLAKRLGDALKDARQRARLTQSDAGAKAGLSQGAWSLLETSRSAGFSLLTWDRAAHAVGCTLDAYIKGATAADLHET